MISKLVPVASALALSLALAPPTARAIPPAFGPPPGWTMIASYANRDGGANPTQFRAEVESRMQTHIDTVQRGVQRGHLPPAALRRAYAQRSAVERQLDSASADGLITRWESAQIWGMAERVGTGAAAYGGGPGDGVYRSHP
jgi:hypothetical protein